MAFCIGYNSLVHFIESKKGTVKKFKFMFLDHY